MAGPAEARRLLRWWGEYRVTLGGLEVAADLAMPFATSVEYLALGDIGLGRSSGSITSFDRRAGGAGQDGLDLFNLVINRSGGTTRKCTPSSSLALAPGSAVLFDFAEAGAHLCPGGHNVLALMVPRRRLLSALPNAPDLTDTVIPASNEALRLLGYYADRLLDDEDLSNPAVLAYAGQSLVDLVALAFGTDRDNTEIARLRGLRAARVSSVLQRIRRDYADPDLSPEGVALGVGISTRYLHDLLQETGSSFSTRVQDLRLAKALELLRAANGTGRKISDAAYAAGFNDLTHFGRLFRRKYGLTPTAARRLAEFPPG